MAFDWVGPDLVFALMASLMMVTGIIDTKVGASGEAPPPERSAPLQAPCTSVWVAACAASELALPAHASRNQPTQACVLCVYAGFSNTGVLTVLALFVVAEGVTQTGGGLGPA